MESNKNNINSKRNKIHTDPINDAPFPAYEGDEPYIFVSYSHDDSPLVFPEIEKFHNDGYNVWYDEGITSGEGWHEIVENAILNSSLLVFFISEKAIASKNVRNEVFLASDVDIPIIKIFLEESELKHGLYMELKTSPQILKYKINEKEYISTYRSLFEKYGFKLNESNFTVEERIDNPPFEAYHGNEPYIFVSYSHSDSDSVYPELERFHNDGYNIWYDEGIPSGERWQEEVETALNNSSLFVVFISRNSVDSKNVRNEIFSASGKIPIIPIYLESTKLAGHGLALKLRDIQSIYKHKMSENGYIKRYRNEFKKRGFKVKSNTSSDKTANYNSKNETEQLIELIENKIFTFDEKISNDYIEVKELYDDAINDKNEDYLKYAEKELKSIFDKIYVSEYLLQIKNAPKRLPYPSLKLNMDESIRNELIQSTFLELEKSNFTNQEIANDLIQHGHLQNNDGDMEGLEKTVVKLYKESQFSINEKLDKSYESELQENNTKTQKLTSTYENEYLNEFEQLNYKTNTIYDLEEYNVLIILNDGTNLTSWTEVEDLNEILYISEDLTDLEDLTEKYANLKSLKAIVTTEVSHNLTNMKNMFSACSSLKDISALKDWNTQNVSDMNGMFKGCSSLEDISALKDWNTQNVSDMNGMFDGCILLEDISALKDWKTDNLTDISGMFYGCTSLINTNALKNWDTSNLKFMTRVFRGCSSLVDVSALKNWNTGNVSDMNAIFKGCTSLIDIFSLKNWNISNTTDLSGVFYDCPSLKDILALKNWKTKNVFDMSGMFKGCSSINDISSLKDWKTANVVDMSEMFEGCSSLIDLFPLKNWNTKKLKDINKMFYNCCSIEDASSLDNWDISKIMYKNEMFDGCSNIKELPKWYK